MEKKGRICIGRYMGGKINWVQNLLDGEGEGGVSDEWKNRRLEFVFGQVVGLGVGGGYSKMLS